MFTVEMDLVQYGFDDGDAEKKNFDTEQEAKDFIYEKIKSIRSYWGEYEGIEGDFDLESYYDEYYAAYTFDTDLEETYIYRLIGP